MARTVIRGEQIKDNSVTGADVDEGSLRYTVRDFNSSGDVLVSDYCIRCTSGGITLNLPTRSNNGGHVVVVKDAMGNAGSSPIVIDASGDETIDGGLTHRMSENYESVTLICDGINGWMVVGIVS